LTCMLSFGPNDQNSDRGIETLGRLELDRSGTQVRTTRIPTEELKLTRTKGRLPHDQFVRTTRIPTEELKRTARFVRRNSRSYVRTTRIPTEELKLSTNLNKHPDIKGPNDQNSDRGIETCASARGCAERCSVRTTRIPTEELKRTSHCLAFSWSFLSERPEFRPRN